jgi:hypothetical protein
VKVELLVLHRRERYQGEHAPEVVSVCDEVTLEENPSWWPSEVEKQKAAVGDDASAWAVVTIELPAEALLSALYPDNVAEWAWSGSRKV